MTCVALVFVPVYSLRYGFIRRITQEWLLVAVACRVVTRRVWALLVVTQNLYISIHGECSALDTIEGITIFWMCTIFCKV